MRPRRSVQRTGTRPFLRRRRPQLERSDLFLWCLLVLCALVVLLGGGLALLTASQRILPGVESAGVRLGMMTQEAAVQALEAQWAVQTITVIDGHPATANENNVGVASPAMLGMILDADATFQRAYEQSRQWGHIGAMLAGRPRVVVSPTWSFDRGVAELSLYSLAVDFFVPPVDASLRLLDTQVQTEPPVPGRAVDVPATLAQLERNPHHVLAQQRLDLVMTPVEPRITDLSAALTQARQLLSYPLVLRAYDPVVDRVSSWDIAPDEWASWLEIGVEAGEPPTLRWDLDAQQVQTSLAELATTLAPDRTLDPAQAAAAIDEALSSGSRQVGLRVYHRPGQHTVVEGETLTSIAFDHGIPYPWIQQANPGVSDQLRVGQNLTIPSPDILLPLEPLLHKRVAVSLSKQMMWAYENGGLIWEWPVSTGMPSSPTSPGVFQIQSHEEEAYAVDWGLSMPYFMGIYLPAPGANVMNGFHGFPTRDGAPLLWMNHLGEPVTFGCIMVSTDNAARLYDWAEEGTIVVVQP